jgi:STE24 endopeptidase
LWRYGLQNALVVVLGLVLIEGLYAIIWWSGIWWWFVAALATFVVTVLLGQLLPVLILPLFYQIERLEDDALTGRLERLIDGTSLSLEGVYRMKLSSETVKANALLAGLGRTRRVILGDTLLEQFTAEEIEVVFAHEVGHHVHRHISKLLLLGFFTSILGYLASDGALRWWVWYQEGAFGYHELPVYTLPLILFMVTVISLISSPMRNALSRRFETQCDRYALRRTRNPVAYRGAFSKLAQLNKADPQPHPWEVWLMHDHPPIAARLALAEGWDVEAVDS